MTIHWSEPHSLDACGARSAHQPKPAPKPMAVISRASGEVTLRPGEGVGASVLSGEDAKAGDPYGYDVDEMVGRINRLRRLLGDELPSARRLCIPIVEVYLGSAVEALDFAVAAAFQAVLLRNDEGLRERPPAPPLDPRLLEWLA